MLMVLGRLGRACCVKSPAQRSKGDGQLNFGGLASFGALAEITAIAMKFSRERNVMLSDPTR